MARNNEFTARDIIYQSLSMIGVYSLGEVIDDADAINALNIFNELLESFSGDGGIVPYVESITFNMTAERQEYIFGNIEPYDIKSRKIAQLVTVNYQDDDVIYPVNIISKNVYYKQAIVSNLDSLPYNCFLTDTTYNSILTFYPLPDKAYKCIVRAKFVFNPVELDDRLDEMPPYMRGFFRYALARELTDFYGKQWPQSQEMKYAQALNAMYASAENDLTFSGSDTMTPSSYHLVRSGRGY